MNNSTQETQNTTKGSEFNRFELTLEPSFNAPALPSDLMNPSTPSAMTDASTKTPWSYPSSVHNSFSADCYQPYPYATSHFAADVANPWEYNPMHGVPGSAQQPASAQLGVNIPLSRESFSFPLIITEETEVSTAAEKTPSYAQIARSTLPEAEAVEGQSTAESTDAGAYANAHQMQHQYSYVPYYPIAGSYMGGYGYPALPPEQPKKRKFAPRDHDDLSEKFRALTDAKLPTVYAGSRHREINGVAHTRQELTFVALGSMFGGRHFHDLDPMELGEFNHSMALILEAIPSAATIVVPFGFLRKEHPSPYCLVQCQDFAAESKRLGIKKRPYVKLEYEPETECKDITACLQSICKGQLNYLKHTSLLQAMKDRIDLTLLYFLIYDCFRADFVNFEIEFRNIREGPVQICIRTSKRYICKRKNTVIVDPHVPGIDCRVAHSTEHWKKLPDVPVSVIEAPLEGTSALPPPISPVMPKAEATTAFDAPRCAAMDKVCAFLQRMGVPRVCPYTVCCAVPACLKAAYERHKNCTKFRCPALALEDGICATKACVSSALTTLKGKVKHVLHNSGIPCPRRFFSDRANIIKAFAAVGTVASATSLAVLAGRSRMLRA